MRGALHAVADLIQSDRTLSAAVQTTLAALAALMIPAEGLLPAASDAAILSAIVAELARDPATVAKAASDLDTLCTSRFNGRFESLAHDRQMDAVDRLRDAQPAFVRLFESAVATCYYRDPRVQQSLGMPGRSPFPGGYAVKPTDWSLLEPVRGRTPFWRHV
jgi:hypothetical protein